MLGLRGRVHAFPTLLERRTLLPQTTAQARTCMKNSTGQVGKGVGGAAKLGR